MQKSCFGLGKPRVRIGHFEIPYGIEHAINTNGTLRNYRHSANLGIKADWGLAINGETTSFEYEVSASRGSAQSLHHNSLHHNSLYTTTTVILFMPGALAARTNKIGSGVCPLIKVNWVILNVPTRSVGMHRGRTPDS